MLVIRLSRTGRKKQPYYRVVVADKRSAVKGHAIEVLGHFDPRTKALEIDVERAKERLANGAQPSETAEALLEKAGVLKRSAITEKNRRPERKKRKELKAEADGGGEGAAPAGDASADADGQAEKPADDAGEQPAEAKDEKPADDAKAEDKPEEKPAEDAKAEDKPAEEAKPAADAKDSNESDDTDKPNQGE